MGIGAAVFLIVFGAILTFAVDWHVAGLDLAIVGWILMIAGAVWGGFKIYGWNRRRAARTQTVVEEHRYPRTVVEEPHVQQNATDPTAVATQRLPDERPHQR